MIEAVATVTSANVVLKDAVPIVSGVALVTLGIWVTYLNSEITRSAEVGGADRLARASRIALVTLLLAGIALVTSLAFTLLGLAGYIPGGSNRTRYLISGCVAIGLAVIAVVMRSAHSRAKDNEAELRRLRGEG